MELPWNVGDAPEAASHPAVVVSSRPGRQALLIDELQTLLHRRLRSFAAFALLGFTFVLLLSFFAPASAFRRAHAPFVAVPVFIVLIAGLNVLLFSRWSESLRRLH